MFIVAVLDNHFDRLL